MEKPSENQFKEHWEQLLNVHNERDSSNDESFTSDIDNLPYIPVLDNLFSMSELDETMCLMKKKSYVGICPALLTVFDVSWRLFLLRIFNVVFSGVCFPVLWCHSKLVVLFKSGNRMMCNNYREISIMDTLAKLYDTMILNRLKLWWNIDKCQAGAQKGRGCVEQITALRLLCDYVKYKKTKLYVVFVDFSKAYDRVPRRTLIECLKNLGCGRIMTKAIRAMYTCTKNVMNSAVID